VFQTRPRPDVLAGTAGCGAQGKTRGRPFRPEATGEGKAGGVNDAGSLLMPRQCDIPSGRCRRRPPAGGGHADITRRHRPDRVVPGHGPRLHGPRGVGRRADHRRRAHTGAGGHVPAVTWSLPTTYFSASASSQFTVNNFQHTTLGRVLDADDYNSSRIAIFQVNVIDCHRSRRSPPPRLHHW
jgi:hypothetical protein